MITNSDSNGISVIGVKFEAAYYYNLYNYCYQVLIKSRRLRWAGHVARMEEGRSALKILTGIPKGKRPLGRPRRR